MHSVLVPEVGGKAAEDVEGVAIAAAAAVGYMSAPGTAVAAGSLDLDCTEPALGPGPGVADSSGSFVDAEVGRQQPASRSAWSLLSFQAYLAWACQYSLPASFAHIHLQICVPNALDSSRRPGSSAAAVVAHYDLV